MRIKSTEIRIGDIEDFKKTVGKATKYPAPDSDKAVIFVRDAKMVSKILSEKRLELMRAIKEHSDYNVSQLARLLDRKQEAVSRDLSLLRRYGIVDIKRKERGVYPEVKPTHVLIEI